MSEKITDATAPVQAPLAPAVSPDSGLDASKHADLVDMTVNARRAADKERGMTLMQGLRLYPKAAAWSMLISMCIVMEGFQVCLTPNLINLQSFASKFGHLNSKGVYEVEAKWIAGLTNGATVGQIIGLFIAGIVAERIGYRYTVIIALVWITAFLTLFVTANNLTTLLMGEILCGLPWGAFQTICISYAAEVCPIALRGYLTCFVNCCWGIGQVIGIGVIKAQADRNDMGHWSWRLPYALQWMWPVPLAIGVFFAPESPWWLVRRGRLEDAKKNLLRLTSLNRDTEFDADETIDMMRHTTELEQEITAGASYLDCFKGVDLRRTEIVAMTWAIQNLSGNSFSGYSAYFLTKAGVSPSHSYSFALGQYSINIVGVFGAWALMAWGIGRRRLYVGGLACLCVALFVMGFLGLVPKAHRDSGAMATGAMMIIWAACYQLTVGSVCYSLVAELSTRRLQIKTVVIGRMAYNIIAIICNILTPYMLNESAWNWGNFAGFFWGGSCFLSLVYAYFRIPEPRGRTFAEIDVLFERKVPARKFESTKVDPFEVHLDEKRHSVSHVELPEKA
ncbi:uncharacterized protein CcaverHIS019_0309230 [Cutaneotrichosporon cavernicola]|uniref:Major facilitator superfamily (MFS) profile domain-containing protein n=1 Tax=Cutaneotrichosporon cavernicola TaxID=279322 RepID=A0AA48IH40_9TREE|nr:uncharacterized protein CcaverHIS019_0309230 [Cutaneotrichosporon cavernicola]BEI90853.1 hypothetical protein CcaverHIS019_0309230 [Cutaneotrichosporon cavernicola]BEI98632.1 hypothetical protein CcaverHIS631_0309310 [Cutaneotrichosporon cavernicola]BEJ06401.1 hypothetical protein CcaverHIS641_0309230 [Cutaneotrichosporon cavernicola]